MIHCLLLLKVNQRNTKEYLFKQFCEFYLKAAKLGNDMSSSAMESKYKSPNIELNTNKTSRRTSL